MEKIKKKGWSGHHRVRTHISVIRRKSGARQGLLLLPHHMADDGDKIEFFAGDKEWGFKITPDGDRALSRDVMCWRAYIPKPLLDGIPEEMTNITARLEDNIFVVRKDQYK